ATTAQLTGTVNPEGAATTARFQWGTTISVTSWAPSVSISAGAGLNPVNITTNITGLVAGTLYYYRIRAVNASGTSVGQLLSFATPGLVPLVITDAASNITANQAQLNGRVAPRSNSVPSSVYFEWAITNTTFTATSTNNTTSIRVMTGTTYVASPTILANLTPNTRYWYRIVAINSGGRANGGVASFLTGQPSITYPAPPTTLITTSSAVLNGRVNPNSAPVTTTVYFEYGISTTPISYPNRTPSRVITGTTIITITASLTSLLPGSRYNFRLVAVNSGIVFNGANQTFLTLAPVFVGAPSATLVTASSAQLNSTVNPNSTIDSSYVYFEYGISTTPISYPSSTTGRVEIGTTNRTITASLTSLLPGTLYNFRLVAICNGVTFSGANGFFTTLAPTVTTNPASAIAAYSAQLNATVNPQGTTVAAYFEYGTTITYGNTTAIRVISGTGNFTVTATPTSLIPGTLYNFRIVAIYEGGRRDGANRTFTTLRPVVTTNAASNIAAYSAQLNATVNPNGAATVVSFEYGTTITYGNTTAIRVITGTGNFPVSTTLTSLIPGTLYNFRVVATYEGGSVIGLNQSFTTLAPTVATNPASAIAAYSAQLNALVNPNGISTAVFFEWGTTITYGNTTNIQVITGTVNVAITATIPSLIPATTYNFRIVAIYEGGRRDGANLSFTTVSMIRNQTASNITTNSAQLNAEINPQGITTTAYFQWGITSTVYTTSTGSTNMGSGTLWLPISTSLSGLLPYATYYFRAVAEYPPGGRVNGVEQSFTTQAIPPTVYTLSPANVTSTSVIATGQVNPNGAPTTYQFQIATTDTFSPILSSSPSVLTSIGSGRTPVAVSATFTGLTPSTPYYYRVFALNTAGAVYGDTTSFTTTDPDP
ncbi:MAG: fibronectin type III domain-containing protein, partial [Planctomycetota bacterium]|nr:fibronectin type III domain-containing protein [Planctomycetota bacterium]